jgi:bifunctional DNA-binding transcriptional regulator/antitoxin component of YhaV-PrlF toxin-antitoxin module
MLQRVKTHLLTVQSRGTVALPADFRRRFHLDGEDAQVKLVEREDGKIELIPVVAVPADQAWFWSERWQAMEREADADIAAGRTTTVDDLGPTALADLPASVGLTPEYADIGDQIERKITGINLYSSQIENLFTSTKEMARQVRAYGAKVGAIRGDGGVAERYWSTVPA